MNNNMAALELKKLVTTLPGESTGTIERWKELGIRKFDLKAQSIELEGPDRERVSCLIPDGKPITSFLEDVHTLYDGFQRGLRFSRNANCLGWRSPGEDSYQWISYEEVYKRAQAFGSGLIKAGFPAGQDTMVGIFSKNRVEWVLTEQAANIFSMIVVPLYDTFGEEACKYICNKTEMKVVVCEKESQALMLVESSVDIPALKTIIVMDKMSEETVKKAKEKDISLLTFQSVEEDGSGDLKEPVPPKPEDICTICFTSGTTGNPKGAVLAHSNIIIGCNGFYTFNGDQLEIRTGDVHFSYLPLAHIYERFMQALLFMNGASIGFFQGDPKALLDDLACLQATIFPCVPRIMNKLHEQILAAVSEKNKVFQTIFFKALKEKKKEVQRGILRNNGVWDLVFKKIRMKTGGRVRLLLTGAAPVAPEVKLFMRAIFGCLLLEGYGQTETAAIVTASFPRDLTDGHVGALIPTVTVKLVDVPDLDYFSSNNQGEICVKGGTIFQGYYKDPEKTAETIDKDGYLHSGDIGEWLPNGQLKIIDRVKHIFKLSQGEYVAPEKVENEYLRAESVGQIFVHGNSLEDCCVAIVVPNEEWVLKVAKQRRWDGNFKALCQKKELKDLIFANMNDFANGTELKGFEKIKCITLHSELFSVENGFLTPTLKSKRPVLKKFFADKLKALYAEVAEQTKQSSGSGRAVEKEKADLSPSPKSTDDGSAVNEEKSSKDENMSGDGNNVDEKKKRDGLKESGSEETDEKSSNDKGDDADQVNQSDALQEDGSKETEENVPENGGDEDRAVENADDETKGKQEEEAQE